MHFVIHSFKSHHENASTAAEPSPGFNFNIALHGSRAEDLGGTELAAEFGFASLQKFGQEFLKKLNGKKMPNKLLERVSGPLNIGCCVSLSLIVYMYDYDDES